MNKKNYKYIVGIDEVGRGPIAGPVTVCAFCVAVNNMKKVHKSLEGITDSKKLTVKKREAYFTKIKELKDQGLIQAGVSVVSAKIIDTQGIIFALNLALVRSLEKLNLDPKETFVYLDGGLYAPDEYDQETVIKGDSKIWHISAASVVAKVLRDKKMVEHGNEYPEYGFAQHKGYGTQKHREAIKKHGITILHRSTWIK